MSYTLRKGTLKDLNAVYELVRQLAVYEKEPTAVTATLEDYQIAFENQDIYVDVAVVDEAIVGITLYYHTFSTWKGKMMYLEDFYIEPQYRGSGIGIALFDLFLSTAKQHGCILTKWQVLDWNQSAVDFYLKRGATIEKTWWNGKLYLE